MIARIAFLALLLTTACASAPPVASRPDFLNESAPKAKVLMLGVFHFSNPGLDAYKTQHAFDVTTQQRQKEVAELITLLAAFKPTKIALEFKSSRQAEIDKLYQQYLRDEYELGTNEVYQIGFRLARRLGHSRVYLVDAPARYYTPYKEHQERVKSLENTGALKDANDGWNERYKQLYAYDDELKTKQTLREHLLYINSESRIRESHGHYLVSDFKQGTALADDNDAFLGPDLMTGWFNRNLRIFRNLQRLTESKDERILLVIGSGHLPILRFLAENSPEYELVDVDEYL